MFLLVFFFLFIFDNMIIYFLLATDYFPSMIILLMALDISTMMMSFESTLCKFSDDDHDHDNDGDDVCNYNDDDDDDNDDDDVKGCNNDV